MKKITKLCF